MSTIAAVNAVFPSSAYVPLAIGFFGLGVGYFVWGGQLLFGFPRPAPRRTDGVAEPSDAMALALQRTERSIGIWGIWMPGFMQFLTGIFLLVGLSFFRVFEQGTSETPLYMAGLAFTAYGVHWFSLGYRRYIQADVLPDFWMAIPFFLISVLGVVVFWAAKDWAVVILFILLALIYLSEALVRGGMEVPLGDRLVGFWQFINGCWLMYLTWAVALTLSTSSIHWPF